MTVRRPLVQIAGQLQELPAGDTLPGGGTTRGTATIDFGAWPGSDFTSLDITGQAGILSGATVRAWIRLAATADHSIDEHIAAPLRISAGNVVAGTGFTIYAAFDALAVTYGQYSVHWEWSN